MSGLDPAVELPTEIFHEILTYLDANDLARVTRVNRLWNELGGNGILWQALCRSRWEGKRYMRRVYDIGMKIWSYTPDKWKWAYGEAELESQRTATTESEIVESYWKFTFTNGLASYNYPIFEPNNMLIQPDVFPGPLSWQLLAGGYFLVSRMPPLHISRNRATWAWTISNALCLYVATEHPGMERRIFGYGINQGLLTDEYMEGGYDNVDEVAERRGAMPKRGDGGWVAL